MNVQRDASEAVGIRRLKAAAQALILGLVVWGIWRAVSDAGAKFAAEQFSPWRLDGYWLLLAAALYGAGMLPSGLFWQRTLRVMGQRPPLLETMRAFYVGHLGKYVPGKALVVVIRADLLKRSGVDWTIAATSVFVETLTMMAVGAALAAAILAIRFHEQHQLFLLAVALACCAGLPTWPPLFRRIVTWLQVRRVNPHIDGAVQHLGLGLIAYGWLTVALGWFVLGLSLWAIIKAVPGAAAGGPLADLPLLTACVALAVVAGFLSLLPGGVGVRELVIMALLAPRFGDVVAIVAAITLRVVSLATEVAIAASLAAAVRVTRRNSLIAQRKPRATPTRRVPKDGADA